MGEKIATDAKHTPLPWSKSDGAYPGIEGPHGHICTFEEYDGIVADRDLILRAVNSHGDLVRALEKIFQSDRFWINWNEAKEQDVIIRKNEDESKYYVLGYYGKIAQAALKDQS